MAHFSDLHMHALFGVDDGPKTEDDMYAVLDAAYADGTRYMCLTPHFHPGYYRSDMDNSAQAFTLLKAYAGTHYPDMHLAIGNELHYSKDCVSRLADGLCRTMNGTDYVLVDFNDQEDAKTITTGLHQLLNAGYTHILAYAERYSKMHRSLKELKEYSAMGVLLQMDSQSILGGFGLFTRERAQAMLKAHLVDLVSSDAHDTAKRPPQISAVYAYIAQKYDTAMAQALCYHNGRQLLWGSTALEEETYYG